MRAKIESLKGDRDAIRFGQLRFDGYRVLSYVYDRLSGNVTLLQPERTEQFGRSAPSAEEMDAARCALHAALPPLDPGLPAGAIGEGARK